MSTASQNSEGDWEDLLESDEVRFSDDMFEAPGRGSQELEDFSEAEAVDIRLPPGFGLNNYEATVDEVVADTEYKSEGVGVRVLDAIERGMKDIRQTSIEESKKSIEQGRPFEGALSWTFGNVAPLIGSLTGPLLLEYKKETDIRERFKMPDVKAVNRLDDGDTNPIYVDSQVISYHESDNGRWMRVYSTEDLDVGLALDVYDAVADYEV